jgi:hypothetical protein
MTPAVLALPSGLFRLQCHLKSLSLPSPIPTIKAFSSSLALGTEETPAMKALKDIPYPSASPDSSIFESWSDEYDGVSSTQALLAQESIKEEESTQYANQRYHESRVLEQLSWRKQFGQAEQVRQELAEMNVPIRPSSAYYRAAWSVLRQRPWPPNRTEMFINWLSLLPSMTSDRKPLRFVQLTSALLFSDRHVDLKTVAQYGVVLSSKGYIRRHAVGPSVVACLTRYADPDVSSRILDEMIAANEDFTRSDTTHYRWARKNKRTTRRLLSIAVRTHCTAGRPEVALQMARRAHEHDFRLTRFTYEYLLGKLDADGLNDLAAELRAHPCCGSLDVAKSRHVDISDRTLISPISRKLSEPENKAIAEAILKRSPESVLPARAVDLVPYFDIHKTDLHGDLAVNNFLSRAYRISPIAASTVLLAEQLHHHRRGQFRHVLWVFDKFFHVVSVPSGDITRRLWKREHYPPHLQIPPSYIPRRIKETTFNLPSRVWPTAYHTALVWSALVHLCESEEELFALYDPLLQHSAQFQKTTADHHPRYHYHHLSPDSSSTPAVVPAPADKFDAAHFRPFLVAFTLLRDAMYGLRVLDDMQDRGIAPSVEILSTAAALQARRGSPELALRMLDIIRGQIERHGDEDADNADVGMEMAAGSEAGVGGRDRKRQRLLHAYTGVLRGFADRRDIENARRVAELLHSHLGYVEEESSSDDGGADAEDGGDSSRNARTDVALRFLRRLEVEGPSAEPESLTDSDEVDADYFYPFLKVPDPEVCTLKLILFYLSPTLPSGFPIATLCIVPLGENRAFFSPVVETHGGNCTGHQDPERSA